MWVGITTSTARSRLSVRRILATFTPTTRRSRYVGPFEGFGIGPALLHQKTPSLIRKGMPRFRQSVNANVKMLVSHLHSWEKGIYARTQQLWDGRPRKGLLDTPTEKAASPSRLNQENPSLPETDWCSDLASHN